MMASEFCERLLEYLDTLDRFINKRGFNRDSHEIIGACLVARSSIRMLQNVLKNVLKRGDSLSDYDVKMSDMLDVCTRSLSQCIHYQNYQADLYNAVGNREVPEEFPNPFCEECIAVERRLFLGVNSSDTPGKRFLDAVSSFIDPEYSQWWINHSEIVGKIDSNRIEVALDRLRNSIKKNASEVEKIGVNHFFRGINTTTV